MKTHIYSPALADGEAIATNSLWADFARGDIGVEELNWAWLCGLDIYSSFPDENCPYMAMAVIEDISDFRDGLGEDDCLIRALSRSPKAFLKWTRGAELNGDFYATCEMLLDKTPDPAAFIRSRALDAVMGYDGKRAG